MITMSAKSMKVKYMLIWVLGLQDLVVHQLPWRVQLEDLLEGIKNQLPMLFSELACVPHDHSPEARDADLGERLVRVLNAVEYDFNDLVEKPAQALKEAREQLNEVVEGVLAGLLDMLEFPSPHVECEVDLVEQRPKDAPEGHCPEVVGETVAVLLQDQEQGV